MSKRKRNTLIFIGLGALALGYWLSRKKSFKRNPEREKEIADELEAGGLPKIIWRDDSLPLSYGSSGQRVVELQKYLNSLLAGIREDGYWGPETQEAVERFLESEVITASQYRNLGLLLKV